jgi:hypothetical protein
MTEERKESMHAWLTEAAMKLGVPTAICGALLGFQYIGSEREFQRAMKQEERMDSQAKYVNETLTTQLANSTAALQAINQTMQGFREDQRETRQVLREVAEKQHQ